MSIFFIQGKTLTDIADAIRYKSNSTGKLDPKNMASAINNIQSGGAGIDSYVFLNGGNYYFSNKDDLSFVNYKDYPTDKWKSCNNCSSLDGKSYLLRYYPDENSNRVCKLCKVGNPDLFYIINGYSYFQNSTMNTEQFNSLLSNYNTSRLDYAGWFFNTCSNITTPPEMDYNRITYAKSMFLSCPKLETPVSLPNAIDVPYMYENCVNLKKTADFPCAKNLHGLFQNCQSLINADANFPNATCMNYTYNNCSNITSAIIPQGASYYYRCFSNCVNLKSVSFIRPERSFFDKGYSAYMFDNCNKLESVCNLGAISNCFSMFSNCFRLNKITFTEDPYFINLGYMFENCKNLKEPSIPLNAQRCNNVSACYMFKGCSNLIQPLNDINHLITNMAYMYYGCSKLSTPAPISSNVTSYVGTYSNCTNLTSIPNMNLPYSKNDKCIHMDYMFCNAYFTNKTYLPSVFNIYANCTCMFDNAGGELYFPSRITIGTKSYYTTEDNTLHYITSDYDELFVNCQAKGDLSISFEANEKYVSQNLFKFQGLNYVNSITLDYSLADNSIREAGGHPTNESLYFQCPSLKSIKIITSKNTRDTNSNYFIEQFVKQTLIDSSLFGDLSNLTDFYFDFGFSLYYKIPIFSLNGLLLCPKFTNLYIKNLDSSQKLSLFSRDNLSRLDRNINIICDTSTFAVIQSLLEDYSLIQAGAAPFGASEEDIQTMNDSIITLPNLHLTITKKADSQIKQLWGC